MEDTLLIDTLGKFDFPIPEFGIHDAGAPERVIRCITEEYFLFISVDIADMKFVHGFFSFLIPAFTFPTINHSIMDAGAGGSHIGKSCACCTGTA